MKEHTLLTALDALLAALASSLLLRHIVCINQLALCEEEGRVKAVNNL